MLKVKFDLKDQSGYSHLGAPWLSLALAGMVMKKQHSEIILYIVHGMVILLEIIRLALLYLNGEH